MRKTVILCLALLMLGSCSKVEDLLTGGVWTERAEQITEGCMTDYEKAMAIYEWECMNISYDLDFKITTAQECWDQRKGVCQAYSELFVKLATHCDLEAKVISGKCRTHFHMDGEGGHAWVKVNTEKGWILVDPTWGAGYVSMDYSEFTFYDHNMSWFDAEPELMIFTHFPNNKADQFLSTTVSRDEYLELPLVEPNVAHAGWKGYEVLNYFLNHLGESAPLFYRGFDEGLGKFELVQMPYNGKMKVGETYTLKIKSLAVEEGISIRSWETNHYLESWEQDGDVFTLVYMPESECELHISLNGYGVIMKYDVTN